MADQLMLIKVKELLDEPYSCLKMVDHTRTLTFPNYFIGDIAKGVKELLNLELKKHNRILDGTVIAYENVKILESVANVVGDLPYVTFDVSADYFVFSPRLGSILRGVVNKVSRDHIGCLVHYCFNASILKPYEMEWDSPPVKFGDSVLFEVTHLDHHSKVLFIKGKLVEVEEKENDGQHLEDDGYGSEMASMSSAENLQKIQNFFNINTKTMSEEGTKKYFDLEEESVNDMANCSLNEKHKPCVKRSTVDGVDDAEGSSSGKSDRIEPSSKKSKRKHKDDKSGGKAKKMKSADDEKPKKHRKKDKKGDSSRKKAKASKTKDKSKSPKDKSSKRGDDEVTKSKDRKTDEGKSKVKLKDDGEPKKKVKAKKKDDSTIETRREADGDKVKRKEKKSKKRKREESASENELKATKKSKKHKKGQLI